MLDEKASAMDLVENDQQFHRILSRACGNLLLQIVYDYVVDSFKQYLLHTVERVKPGEKDPSLNDHEAILLALKHRSFTEAKEATKSSMRAWTSAVAEIA